MDRNGPTVDPEQPDVDQDGPAVDQDGPTVDHAGPADGPSADRGTVRRGLRTGWTTGTCASAAAKAAYQALLSGRRPDRVDVALPSGRRVGFPVEWDDAGRAVVVKDAGDDPDCTNGARMTAEVVPVSAGGTHVLRAGDGIGTITKPGLGLDVGAPAINPVPRRMILAALSEVGTAPVAVTFSVPGGQAMAEETTNARLGIVGGISILGTSGIVRPFSTASYRASVVQQIDVAAAQGERTVVLATGARSEAAATRLYPALDPVCVVEVGDFTGIALRRAARVGMRRVVFVGMAGKLAKLAAGVMMTHFHRSEVDTALLAELAVEAGAAPAVVEAATATATARHFFDACVAHGALAPLALLCERARAACTAHAGSAFDLEVVLVDYEGSAAVWRTGGTGATRAVPRHRPLPHHGPPPPGH
jgi:cobalt-precorrin-5B (C1)-methyltransferase